MKEQWHVSKSIPLSFLTAIAVQTVAIVWGAAKLDSRVEGIETWVKTNANTQVNLVIHEQMLTDHDRRISRLEKR